MAQRCGSAGEARFRWHALRIVGVRKYITVKKMLDEMGLRYFQPMRWVEVKRKGALEKELRPVVPSLIFLFAEEQDIVEACSRIGGCLQFMFLRGHKASDRVIIETSEMENFIKVASNYASCPEYHDPSALDLTVGSDYVVPDGTFKGVKGVIIRIDGGNRLVVRLTGYFTISVRL